MNQQSNMGGRRIGWLLGVFAGAFAIGFVSQRGGATPSPASNPVVVAPEVEKEPEAVTRGRELSKVVCAGCHLYPDPSIYDKVTWGMAILPTMEIMMAQTVDDPYSRLEDTPRLREKGFLPTQPVLPDDQWEEIQTFYLHDAPDEMPPRPAIGVVVEGKTDLFRSMTLEKRHSPMTTLVDIDEERGKLYIGRTDIPPSLAEFDAQGKFIRETLVHSAPVKRVARPDGDVLCLIGNHLPTDKLVGHIVKMSQKEGATPAVLLEEIPRSTWVDVADFDGDGQEDLLVCSYGNYVGEISLYFKRDDGYEKNVIIERPGALRTHLKDLDGDGDLDFIVIFAQHREGIYRFLNQGGGRDWVMETIREFHPAWGLCYMEPVDFNKDGVEDLLVVNGDNGDHPDYKYPHKHYHGIRIYQGDGQGGYEESLFLPQFGVYQANARDYDLDGDIDIAAISFFPDYDRAPGEAFVLYENNGKNDFRGWTFDKVLEGRWIVMDSGDLDGDGDQDIVIGSLLAGPGHMPEAAKALWENIGGEAVVLWNTTREKDPKVVMGRTFLRDNP